MGVYWCDGTYDNAESYKIQDACTVLYSKYMISNDRSECEGFKRNILSYILQPAQNNVLVMMTTQN